MARVWAASLCGLMMLAVAAPCTPGDGRACAAPDVRGGAADVLAGEEALEAAETLQLLQARASPRRAADQDLVFVHVPYNFGHSVERVALLGSNASLVSFGSAVGLAMTRALDPGVRLAGVQGMRQPGGEVWGRMFPRLNDVSPVTGCLLAFTPPSLWPRHLAEEYLGGKISFGLLRDPFERLVAQFRGSFGDRYGGSYPEYLKTCDVNGAVRQMMLDYKAKGAYHGGCTFLPQAEFFRGEFGAALALDNRRFPSSFNELMEERGYGAIRMSKEDILHVWQCPEAWAGDLDCETRALVREVYAEDFRLLCERFGYCDPAENTCLREVPGMCPTDTARNRTSC